MQIFFNVLIVGHKIHIIFFCILLCFSCSPQKKLQRLINKHPELIVKDTIQVTIKDTIVVLKHSKDTITNFYHNDTITIIDDRRTILKYFYDTITNNIYHDLEIKQDTIYYEKVVPVEVEKVVIEELTWWEKNNFWVIFLICFFSLLLIYKKLKSVISL